MAMRVAMVLRTDVSGAAAWKNGAERSLLGADHGLDIAGRRAESLQVDVPAPCPSVRHVECFADYARVDRLAFGGVLDPDGGVLTVTRRSRGTASRRRMGPTATAQQDSGE